MKKNFSIVLVIALYAHTAHAIQKPILKPLFGPKQLREAAKAGNLEKVKKMLDKGVDVNSPEKETGATPLHWAIREGHTEIAKLLIDRGANVNTKVSKEVNEKITIRYLKGSLSGYRIFLAIGETPLHVSARYGRTEIVKLLVEKGADANTQVGSDAYTERLLSDGSWPYKGAPPQYVAMAGEIPLQTALRSGHTETAKLLIPKTTDLKGPLRSAINKQNAEMAKLLIEKGADVNTKAAGNTTALHLFTKKGTIDAIKFSLDKSADVNAKDSNLWTPLHYAARDGRIDIAKMLVEKGANINIEGKQHVVLKKSRGKVQEEIIQGLTPLHLAARDGRTELVKFLIEKGANIYATTNQGKTPADLTKNSEIKQILEEEKIRRAGAKKS